MPAGEVSVSEAVAAGSSEEVQFVPIILPVSESLPDKSISKPG
jgi:hypothetical protein